MKTFQEFVREYTQAELDAEAKKVDTSKPIPTPEKKVYVPVTGVAAQLARKGINAFKQLTR